MLSKLLKNDLNKNMRWMWMLFVGTITVAGLSRGCKELAENLAFFKVLSIFFDTIFYSLLVNTIVQPFLRSFLNFTRSIYGDESYLTHTLPVTKNQIFTSKFLTAFIEMVSGFICVIISLLIVFASKNMFTALELLLSTLISGEFSVLLILTLFILLVITEFIMFISIIYFSIVNAYKQKDKKILRTFLLTALTSTIALTILSVIMVIALLISGVDLSSTTIVVTNSTFITIISTGIITYSAITTILFFLTKKEFNKGVNVD